MREFTAVCNENVRIRKPRGKGNLKPPCEDELTHVITRPRDQRCRQAKPTLSLLQDPRHSQPIQGVCVLGLG
jgi:hypothetical protein